MGTDRRGIAVIANPKHGDRIDALDTMYPSELVVVATPEIMPGETCRSTTTYGYVVRGLVSIMCSAQGGGVFKLIAGDFFSVPGEFTMVATCDDPKFVPMVVLIKRIGYRGQLVVGRVEATGRLSYIDGCSDSMLVYPPRQGDPCLNHLHFPPGVVQTQHTHPSIRMGVVIKGAGKAFRVPSRGNSGWEVDLTEGCVFMLPEQEQHSFRTDETDSEMDVVAYHPDSDWGPTDAAHPMRSRTYIGNER